MLTINLNIHLCVENVMLLMNEISETTSLDNIDLYLIHIELKISLKNHWTVAKGLKSSEEIELGVIDRRSLLSGKLSAVSMNWVDYSIS